MIHSSSNTSSDANKLVPLEPPFKEGTAQILDNFPSQNGYLLKLFRMWAMSPRHLRKFASASLLDDSSPISTRLREVVILRTTANHNCEYEWGVHVTVFAKAVNFSEEQIKDSLLPQVNLALWNQEELLLLEVVDQLTLSGMLDPSLKARFQKTFKVEQQLEIFALCGFYSTVSFTANNSEIGLEPFAAKFSDYN